jgi:hypothetical protein
MLGHIELNHAAAVMSQHDQDKQHAKCRRGHGEENLARPNPERGYRERLSKFGKEAYRAWASAERQCAPRLRSPTSVILPERELLDSFRHFPDQISHFGAHSGTAGSRASGDQGPVKPESSSRPAHDRLWSDNQQGPSPATPDPGQPDPKPAVHLSQSRSRTLTFHHRQLLTEG